MFQMAGQYFGGLPPAQAFQMQAQMGSMFAPSNLTLGGGAPASGGFGAGMPVGGMGSGAGMYDPMGGFGMSSGFGLPSGGVPAFGAVTMPSYFPDVSQAILGAGRPTTPTMGGAGSNSSAMSTLLPIILLLALSGDLTGKKAGDSSDDDDAGSANEAENAAVQWVTKDSKDNPNADVKFSTSDTSEAGRIANSKKIAAKQMELMEKADSKDDHLTTAELSADVISRFDASGDGKLSIDELAAGWFKMDADGNGIVTKSERDSYWAMDPANAAFRLKEIMEKHYGGAH